MLLLHKRPIESVFELLGVQENDITYSLGWVLSRSPVLMSRLPSAVFPDSEPPMISTVELQRGSPSAEYTDIELSGDSCHVIIEAKRGAWLPDFGQLNKYAERFAESDKPLKALVVMAECGLDYAETNIQWPQLAPATKYRYLSWRDIWKLADIRKAPQSEMHLCRELRRYLKRLISMENAQSNMVYVVSLGSDTPAWCDLSWIDIVEKRKRYFHPIGGTGWPKEPPNYVAFRYAGRLQSIHHVENSVVIHRLQQMQRQIPEIREWEEIGSFFVYTLGPAIRPDKTVRTGKIYRNGRVWAMLALLLTSSTVAEARDLTKTRLDSLS